MAAVKPIPDGYSSITPYLIVDGAAKAIDFYKQAFGAIERYRLGGPDGRVGHAELTIGGSVVMLADEHPAMGALSPRTVGGTSVGIMVYLPDVDASDRHVTAAVGLDVERAHCGVARLRLHEGRADLLFRRGLVRDGSRHGGGSCGRGRGLVLRASGPSCDSR